MTQVGLRDVVSAVRLAFLGPLALLATACGGTHHSAEGPAKLIVEPKVVRAAQILVDEGIAHPILLGRPDRIARVAESAHISLEGIRIEDPSGHKVTEQRVQSERNVVIPLDPGSYRLVSYQRTCDGNCAILDPASDSCSSGFTADGPVSAQIRVSYGSGCTISFETN